MAAAATALLLAVFPFTKTIRIVDVGSQTGSAKYEFCSLAHVHTEVVEHCVAVKRVKSGQKKAKLSVQWSANVSPWPCYQTRRAQNHDR